MRIFFITLICLFNCSCAYRIHQLSMQSSKAISMINIEQPSLSLQDTEQLVYAVDWAGIPSGQIILNIDGKKNIHGQKYYHLSAQARPNGFFRFFYDVKYTVESYFGLDNKPQYFIKKRILNSQLAEETIIFDYITGKLKWDYSNPKASKELGLKENTQDLLSSLYYLRLQSLEPGQSYKINIVYNGNYWPVNLEAPDIYEIQIAGKKINAIMVTPISELNKNITGFNQIQVYFSLNKYKVPVLFRMRTKIGYLNGVLLPEASKCKDLN